MIVEPVIQRDLYEVRIALATRWMVIRVREVDAEAATLAVLAHHPGWDLVEVTRWQGEGWVPA